MKFKLILYFLLVNSSNSFLLPSLSPNIYLSKKINNPSINYYLITNSHFKNNCCKPTRMINLKKNNINCNILAKKEKMKNINTFFYIIIWYVFSTLYNIENKIRLNLLNLPYLQSSISLGTGTLFINILWFLKVRKKPNISKIQIKKYLPLSFFHSIGHISAVVAVAGGAVSFTQIIKAAEPVFTCGLNWLLIGDSVNLPSFLSILSIILGVSLASVSSLTFTWISFWGSMTSNLAFASRNVYSRLMLSKKNINPEDLFAILTILSFGFSIPFMLIFEAKKIIPTIIENSNPINLIISSSIKTGLYFYIYNEAAMKVLKNLNPITHSIANSLKRIIILITCIIFFNTPINKKSIIGAIIALIGSYTYSQTKNK